MSIFHLPDLGEGLHEAEIVAWHVGEGDHVVAGQPLVSVETDKAVVEVPSPESGRITALHGAPGDRIETGAPLVTFAGGPAPDSGVVVGDAEPTRPAARPAAAGPSVRATPAVRAAARRAGVDLATVTPSGAQGQITADDVARAAAGTGAAGEVLSGPRLAMARNMARAHEEVVPATVNDDAVLPTGHPEFDVTIALVRAIAHAARAEPALNAWFDGHELRRTLQDSVDVGVAVDTPDGLFVPVIREAESRTAEGLRGALEDAKSNVATRRIKPEDLRGQTITLSNFGLIGGRYAQLVVVPPQVAIVGAGRIRPRVVAIDGEAVVRQVLPLSLTFDHRAVTGGEAARFLAALVQFLEQPDG